MAGLISRFSPQPQLRRENDEIRLAMLQPGNEGSLVECSLSIFPLRDAPPYEALSYTWASKEPPVNIILDGRAFKITGNLWLALKSLRSSCSKRVLWVDQLCIDQGNAAERNHQVKIMGSIYSNANTVLIWLGSASAAESAGLRILIGPKARLEKRLSELDEAVRKAREAEQNQARAAVGALCKRDYWSRIWVVQEVALAKNKIICCGGLQMPWHAFQEALRYINMINNQASLPLRPTRHIEPAQILDTVRRGMDLTSLLLEFRQWYQHDPRDKVFGLLGLAKDARINPDYTKTMQEVFIEATKVCIRERNDLSVLCQSHPCGKSANLPSWVPDWTSQEGPKTFDWIRRHYKLPDPFDARAMRPINPQVAGRLRSLPPESERVSMYPNPFLDPYTAENGINLVETGNKIELTGKVLATVRSIAGKPMDSKVKADILQTWKQTLEDIDSVGHIFRTNLRFLRQQHALANDDTIGSWENASELLKNFIATDDSIEDNITGIEEGCSQSWTVKFYSYGNLIPELCVDDELWRKLHLDIQCLRDLERRESSNGTLTAKRLSHVFKDRESSRHLFELILPHRQLYVSNDSWGIGPEAVQVGDYICWLAGCDVPVILRQINNDFDWIGETYLANTHKINKFLKSEDATHKFMEKFAIR